MEQSKGGFNSNFGFLMASIGSAVGLGNLWGFPYKMGAGGGFIFLLLYLILAVVVGYPTMLGEISLGRKTGKACIEAYRAADSRFTFNGIIETAVPFFLICFYCTFGGYVMKYMVANFGDIFGAGWGIGETDSGSYFNEFVGGGTASPIVYGLVFLVLTVIIVLGGVSGGIEKFTKIAMPALFIMLVVVVIRACTLPGAGAGLEFIFKPDFTPFKGLGWLKVLGQAGSQMFFSISLASGCLVTYGSYLDKKQNLEANAVIIPAADTIVAILAAMAVMPAVFAAGLEPGSGPGLLFVSLQSVFQGMGTSGPIFGFIFFVLVFFAALTSSIGMMEGAVSAMLDAQIRKGKSPSRVKMSLIFAIVPLLGSTLVSADGLGMTGFWNPLLATLGPDSGKCWLDVFDLVSEGLLMPLGALFMAIMLGWTRRGYLDDEILSGSTYKTKAFCDFCWKYLIPILLIGLLLVQLNSFLGFTTLF